MNRVFKSARLYSNKPSLGWIPQVFSDNLTGKQNDLTERQKKWAEHQQKLILSDGMEAFEKSPNFKDGYGSFLDKLYQKRVEPIYFPKYTKK